jgi:hypothetical protein
MHWFKPTNFRERALLFPQRCSQGHVAANAASCGNKPFPAAGGGGFLPRCWFRRKTTAPRIVECPFLYQEVSLQASLY